MNLFQQFRNFFVTIALTMMLFVTVGFDFGAMETTSSPKLMPDQQGIQIAEKTDTLAQDMDGKTQEEIGNITDNPEDKVMGRAKQGQSDMTNATEDAKDKAQELQDKSKTAANNVEGGNMIEDMKNTVKDVFN